MDCRRGMHFMTIYVASLLKCNRRPTTATYEL